MDSTHATHGTGASSMQRRATGASSSSKHCAVIWRGDLTRGRGVSAELVGCFVALRTMQREGAASVYSSLRASKHCAVIERGGAASVQS
jgi:hypothetical protein